jgi:hypothetical protein
MVSCAVLTEAPEDALDLPLAASALLAALRAESSATLEAANVAVLLLTVPAGKLLVLVPEAAAPLVLT